MSHFGNWLSAYVDGQLSPARATRLEMHTAVCKRCALELESIGAARNALLAAVDVEPGPDLNDRLMRAAAEIKATDNSPRRGYAPAELQPHRLWQENTLALTGDLRASHRSSRLALVAGAICAVLLGTLAAQGAPTTVMPDLSDIDALTILAGGQSRGTTVQQVNFGEQSNPIMVREQQGKLDTQQLDAALRTQIANREVFVLSAEPLHLVWQSGDIVVDLVATAQSPAVAEVIANYPNHAFSSGFEHRIARGWATLTGAN